MTAVRRSWASASLLVGMALVVAVACTSDDEDTGPTPTTAAASAPTTAWAGWSVEQTDAAVTVDTGAFTLEAATGDGLHLSAWRGDGTPFFADAPGSDGGLFVERNGERTPIASVDDTALGSNHVTFAVTFADDHTGTVEVGAMSAETFAVRLTLDDPAGVSHWGATLGLADDELIYGLTERIVDDVTASEAVPEEVGSLDRRGEHVTMYVTPTMSGYVPFHQSSHGYGLLVDGFLPGEYDIGVDAAPDELTFRFERDPDVPGGSYHVFAGPGHAAITRAYHDLTGHPTPPPDAVFLHWRGRDELPIGEPAEYAATEMNASVASDLEAYATYDLPAGVYHFDRPWAVGPEGFGELEFDPERFPNAESMLEVMEGEGWTIEVWLSPWAIGARGEVVEENGWLAPGSPRAIDLTDPDAVAWLEEDITTFLASPQGRQVDGFFLDRADEPDVPSTAEAIYADGRNGRQVHNWYPVEFGRIVRGVLDEVRPDTGFAIQRPGYTGSQQHVLRWGGDTRSREGLAIPEAPIETAPSTDLGLRSVLISVQRAAFMGTPYWGSDIGGYTAWVDPEVYARWIQVGFASPLMRFHGMGGTPWATTTTGEPDDELIAIYRRYVELRHAMQPYLVDTAAEAARTGMPMVRPLVFSWPDEPGALDRWDQWMLGPDLLVAPVWASGAREREVWIPPGEWVDFWDRGAVVEGPTEVTVDVPLDELPMWVRPDSPLLDLDVP